MPTPDEVEHLKQMGIRWERAHDLEAIYRARGFPVVDFGRGKTSHYPTDAGACFRKRVLEWMRAPITEATTLESNLVFDMGNAVGDTQAMMAMRAGIYLADESTFEIKDERLKHPFSGRIDVVIRDAEWDSITRLVQVKDTITVVENKSVKSNGYYDVTYPSGFKLIGASSVPKPENLKQIQHYLHYLNLKAKESEDGLVHFHPEMPGLKPPEFGYLCYNCKDDQRLTIWKVWYEPKLWDEIVEEAAVVEHYVDIDVLPARHPKGRIGFASSDDPENGVVKGDIDYGKGRFPCSWKGGSCRYLRLCWAVDIAEKGNEREQERLSRIPLTLLQKEAQE